MSEFSEEDEAGLGVDTIAADNLHKKYRRGRMSNYLRRQGFDLTTYDRSTGYYRPRCSQCEVLVINGIACHETGCPNAR